MNRLRSRSLLETPVSMALFYALVVLILGAECSLFFLAAVPEAFYKLSNYLIKYLSSFIAIIGVLAMMVLHLRDETKRHFIFGIPIALFILMCISISISSSLHYQIALYSVFTYALPMISVPLLYWALHDSTENSRLYTFLLNATIAFASCYAIICIFQSFGISLMNEVYQSFGVRNNRLRLIYSGDFISFGAVLALGLAFKSSRHRTIYMMLFLVMLFELYWVAQTRFFFIGLCVAVVIGFMIRGKSKTIKVFLVLGAGILVLILCSDSLFALLFPDDPVLRLSTSARLEAYSSYSTHSMDMGIFGLGLIPYDSPQFDMLKANIEIGHGGIDDIGVIEYLSRYGICGLVVLIIAFICFFKALWNRHEQIAFSHNPEAWMVLAYFIALAPTMAITDPQRIFFLPYLALMIEHALVIDDTDDARNAVKATYTGEARMIRA